MINKKNENSVNIYSEEKNKTEEQLENVLKNSIASRVIDLATLLQELLEAGIDVQDILRVTLILPNFDYHDYFPFAFRVMNWANWLVVLKSGSSANLTLPADAGPLMVKDASISGPDSGMELYELHISTSPMQIVQNHDGIQVNPTFQPVSPSMVKDASISGQVDGVTIYIAAACWGEDETWASLRKFQYQFPVAA